MRDFTDQIESGGSSDRHRRGRRRASRAPEGL